MSTKIASLHAEITGDNTKLNAALTDSKTKLTGFGGSVGSSMQMLKSFAITAIATGAAMKVMYDGFNMTVGAVVELAAQTRSMSRLSGDTAENTSKMIEVTGDLKIGYEQLSASMKAATRQGIDTSVTGLMKLSDTYLSLNKGVERSQWLLKTFGRSGEDMGALMEIGAAGIQKYLDAINGGQVITQEAMVSAREYEVAVEGLTDAWESFALTVGQKVVPALADLLGNANTVLDPGKAAHAALVQHNQDMMQSAKGYTEYVNEMTRANKVMADRFKAGGQVDIVPKIVFEAARTQAEFEKFQAGVSLATQSINRYRGATGGIVITNADLAAKMATTNERFDQQRTKSLLLAQSMVKLQGANERVVLAQAELKEIQKNWMDNEASDLVGMLGQQMPASSKKSKEAMGAIDEVMGTTSLATQLNQEAMQNLTAEYAKTGNIDKFKEGLIALKDTMPSTTTELDAATAAAEGFKTSIAGILAMDGATLHATFSASITGGKVTGPPSSQDDYGSGSNAPKSKSGADNARYKEPHGGGGSWIIPAGYSETFNLGGGRTASSGERVTVTPVGGGGGGSQNFYAPINVYPKSGDGLAEVMRGLSQ